MGRKIKCTIFLQSTICSSVYSIYCRLIICMHKYDLSHTLLGFWTISRHKLLISKYDNHLLHFSIWFCKVSGWCLFPLFVSVEEPEVCWWAYVITRGWRWKMKCENGATCGSLTACKKSILLSLRSFLSASARWRFPSPLCVDSALCA